VAVTSGMITHIGTYAVYLTAPDGTRYDYLHMRPVTVRVGQRVNAGDVVGYVSNEFGGTPTTIHLHFNIRQNIMGVGWVFVPPYLSLVRAYERLLSGSTTPRYAAQFVRQSFPMASEPFELAAGAVVSGYIEMRNTGTERWRPGRTMLGTTEPRDAPSPIRGPDWLSPNRAATVDREVPPGSVGRFSFSIRAPDSEGVYSQFFGLVEEGVTWFGDDGGPPDRWIQIRLTVRGSRENDVDMDGVSRERGDCDDMRPDVHPGAIERCGDGVDQNCDGVDEACPVDASLIPDVGKDAFSGNDPNDGGLGEDAPLMHDLDAYVDDDPVDGSFDDREDIGEKQRTRFLVGSCGCRLRGSNAKGWPFLCFALTIFLWHRKRLKITRSNPRKGEGRAPLGWM
ncbi:MAG: MopE-related protein, partial [Sandaracinaceae bacterium]|nr:MopE-related protein [Sandaracinaceae bacterium]